MGENVTGAASRVKGAGALLALLILWLSVAGAAQAAPANDSFAGAQALTGEAVSVDGTTVGATHQAGEPDHNYEGASASVWYAWTAPRSGIAVLDACGEDDYVAAVAAYTGSSLDGLTERAAGYCRTSFPAAAGVTYRIAVDSYGGYQGGFTLRLTLHQPPANDDFASPQALAGTALSVDGTTIGATHQAGEPDHDHQGASASVWYRWDAPQDGTVVLDACDEDEEAVDALAAYTGSAIDGLTERAAGYCRVVFPVTAGVTYRIAVDSYYGGSFTLGLSLHPVPANDDFEDAQPLAGTSVATDGSTVGATAQPGEPDHGHSGGSATVWYSWTAPQAGTVTLDLCGDSYHVSGASVYTGTSLGGLTEIAAGYCRLSFAAANGTTYRIAAASEPEYAGDFALALSLHQPPANDDFANAQAIGGMSAAVDGSTVAATHQAGEPDHDGYGGSASVWYAWTAPQSAATVIDVCDDEWAGAVVAVYTGSSVDGLTARASGYCRAVLRVTGGTTYRIAVDSYEAEWGPFRLRLEAVQPPANDDFANARALTGSSLTVDGTTAGASLETGEPDHAGYETAASVWYVWTAPQSGTLSLNACDEDELVAAVAAYSGSSVGSLNEWTSGYCRLSFQVEGGTTYRFAVSSYSGWWGPFTLRLGIHQPPANDDFANALALSGSRLEVTGSTVAATREVGEGYHAGDGGSGSIWYSWSAPQDGDIRIETCGSDFDTVLAVYTGTSLSWLTEIASNDDDDCGRGSAVAFEVEAAVTYRIAVDGYGAGNVGEVRLGLEFTPSGPVQTRQLEVSTSGTGSGRVSLQPGGEPECGRRCVRSYELGTTVTLNAAPDRGSVFAGWSGACAGTGPCEVTMTDARTVTAEFDRDPSSPGGRASIAIAGLAPKAKRLAAGKAVTLRLRVRNVGRADATGVRACAKVPAKAKRTVKAGACRALGLMVPGMTKVAKIKVKATKKARGRVRVTLAVTAAGLPAKKAVAKLTVKPRKKKRR